MIKISFLGSSAKENNFFMAHWFSGKVCVLLGRDCYFERHVALFCRYYHVRYLGWSSHSCVKSLSSFFFFLAKTYLTMPFMLTFSAIIYYANWPVLICQAKMHWGNLSAFTELESLLGSTPADSKVHRHDSDVELNLSNYAATFCSYTSSWAFGCVLSWEKGIVGSKNELRLLIGTWKVRLSIISRSSEELISWVDPY